MTRDTSRESSGSPNYRPPGTRRQMARPLNERRAPEIPPGDERRVIQVAALAVVAVVALLGGAAILAGGGGSPTTPTPTLAANVWTPSPPPATPTSEPTANARRPSPTPRRTPAASATPEITAPPEETPRSTSSALGAPGNPADFDLENQVIEILFPLRSDTRYRYRDNFLNMREGSPLDFNHARARDDGSVLRLHDGIDIYAREGEAVVAPFAGVVVDPAERWPDWDEDRYGVTVVVESTEAATSGYAAVMVHLEHGWVDPGQVVSRGQVLGVLGETGNAEGVEPQLHFELRAPFLLDWSELGMDRLVDAFNPYPSLVRADTTR